MRTQLEQRLQQLKAEFTSGQQLLLELETQQTEIKHTLLRIQGAIQVLEEELEKDQQNIPLSLSEISSQKTINPSPSQQPIP